MSLRRRLARRRSEPTRLKFGRPSLTRAEVDAALLAESADGHIEWDTDAPMDDDYIDPDIWPRLIAAFDATPPLLDPAAEGPEPEPFL